MSVTTVVILHDVASVNGGAAKVAIMEALGLSSRGYRVIYFAASGPVDHDLAESNVEVKSLDQPDVLEDPNRVSAALRGLWNVSAAKEFDRLLGELDLDNTVVHLHGYTRGLSPSIGSVLKRKSAKVVYTMHDFFIACPNGGFFDFQKKEICTRTPLGGACLGTNCDSRQPAHKAWRVLRAIIARTAGGLPGSIGHFIYISDHQKSVVEKYLPDTGRLHFLPNSVDTEQDVERVVAERNDIFLFVGRLTPDKGCVEFAQAARDAGVRAVYLGEGPESERIMEVNPKAEQMGWVSREDVLKWMRSARALVFPSLWYETFGLVASEALSQGLPVILGKWNVASEMIEHGVTGWIYEDKRELDQALTMMTRERAGELSRNAYGVRGGIGITPSVHLDKLEKVYEEVLRG